MNGLATGDCIQIPPTIANSPEKDPSGRKLPAVLIPLLAAALNNIGLPSAPFVIKTLIRLHASDMWPFTNTDQYIMSANSW